MTSHRDLAAWQRADDLAQHIYRLTWKFMQSDPTLAQRMRSAAITVAASISEACRHGSTPQFRRALRVASGALGELGYYLHFARRVGLMSESDLKRVTPLEEEVSRHLDPLLAGRSNLSIAANVSLSPLERG